MWFIKNFDQLTKNQFDQTPKLLENFDQLKMSSEIWSSDRFPKYGLNDGHNLTKGVAMYILCSSLK